MSKRTNRKTQMFLGIFLILFAIVLIGWQLLHTTTLQPILLSSFAAPDIAQQPITLAAPDDPRILRGKEPTLNWIVGRDCPSGLRAYQQATNTNPDAALVGTGWVDPTNGDLIQGANNNCVPGSLSMDTIIQQIHKYGGMAYLTITMETNGTKDSWTTQQETDYITQAATNQHYIDKIIQEVQRAQYDGVIMDMEGTNADTPSIQQNFATYNQKIWAALKPLHKRYGIALVHKLSDHDDYYYLNGFENWQMLGHAADFLVIMALDQSYTSPGPTVSVPWLKQLVDYTLQTMPQMLPHIIWELPLYGAQWRLTNGNWVFDGGINYQDTIKLIASIPPAQIDYSISAFDDPISAHFAYTDTTGVEHTLWYPTAQNLVNILTGLRQTLQRTPQFKGGQLMVAVWYTAMWQPGNLWLSLNSVLG